MSMGCFVFRSHLAILVAVLHLLGYVSLRLNRTFAHCERWNTDRPVIVPSFCQSWSNKQMEIPPWQAVSDAELESCDNADERAAHVRPVKETRSNPEGPPNDEEAMTDINVAHPG